MAHLGADDGIDLRAALSNVDVCHTHIEILCVVLRHGGGKGKGRLCAWACACMLSLVSRRLYARPALLEQTGDPQKTKHQHPLHGGVVDKGGSAGL